MTSENGIEKVNKNYYKIRTAVVIDAPAAKVWQSLTDFDAMPSWSSSFKGIEGKVGQGEKVTAIFKSPVGKGVNKFKHTLIDVEDGVQFAWSDPFLLGMTDHHVYRVEAIGNNKTRFTQTDEVKKGASWLMGGMVAKGMLKTYNQFNSELKQRVEGSQ